MRAASTGGAARIGLVLCAIVAAIAPVTARAQPACGADADGDGVCDDVDNCPAAANPGQEDTFGGPAGDACEHELNVVKLKIKTGTSTTPKGRISAKGDFILTAGEQFTASANVSIRVIDGMDIDVTAPAATGGNPDGLLCTATAVRIRCRGTVPQSSAVFKFGQPDVTGARLVSWTAKMSKLATSQIPQEPVTVIITDEVQGLPFGGVIHDCFPRNGKLTCKEF
jgi:Thrombospondin type 3 repeat